MNWRRTVIRLSSIVAGDITILGWKPFCTNPVIGDDFWVCRLHIPASTDYTAEFDRWHWRSTCPEKTCVGYPPKNAKQWATSSKISGPLQLQLWHPHGCGVAPCHRWIFWLGKAPAAAEEWQRLKPQVYEDRGRVWSSTGRFKKQGNCDAFSQCFEGSMIAAFRTDPKQSANNRDSTDSTNKNEYWTWLDPIRVWQTSIDDNEDLPRNPRKAMHLDVHPSWYVVHGL